MASFPHALRVLAAVLAVAAVACAGQAAAQSTGAKRYYKDSNGQLYYVDKDGALHTVYQGKVLKQDSGGGLYYMENDAKPSGRDETGVLFYEDKDGKVLLQEEDGPGRPIDPLPILRGTDTERQVTKGMRQDECARVLKDCLAGCASRSTEAGRKDCYDACERTRAVCGTGN